MIYDQPAKYPIFGEDLAILKKDDGGQKPVFGKNLLGNTRAMMLLISELVWKEPNM
jgi:hypothetical protein